MDNELDLKLLNLNKKFDLNEKNFNFVILEFRNDLSKKIETEKF